MKREILFLAHRLPFPPDRGDRIRSCNILKHLAQLAPVHVGSLVDKPADLSHSNELSAIAKTWHAETRVKSNFRAGLEALVMGKPVSLTAFHHRKLQAYVREVLATHPIGTIYVFSAQMGQYVPQGWKGRVIVDLVDVDSAKFAEYARIASAPMQYIFRREERLLAREEQRLASMADVTALVSDEEAAVLASRLHSLDGVNIATLQNGVDLDHFDPSAVVRQPEILARSGPQIVFTGQMDYPPNIAAVTRLVHDIMPRVQSAYPEACLHVVGRAPTKDVLDLDGVHGTWIWGEVADIRPFLAASTLVVAPVDLARGVQNKVLEAMAMARPIVLSAGAATGIPATDRVHFVIAESDREFAEEVVGLIGDPQRATRMGVLARQHLADNLTWEKTLLPLADFLGTGSESGRERDAA